MTLNNIFRLNMTTFDEEIIWRRFLRIPIKKRSSKCYFSFFHIYHQVTTASAVNVSAAHHTPPYINVEGIS